MKKPIITVILLSMLLSPAWAMISNPDAGNLYERVYIQTDKNVYLAGELVWLKMLTMTESGIPLSFSRTGYIQLVNNSGPKAQAILELTDGTGNGTLLLPTGLETGCYRLIGYTRYQRNESSEVFFENIIAVVNPVNAEVALPQVTGEEKKYPAGNTDAGIPFQQFGINLTVNGAGFDRRSPVEIKLQNIPEDIHTLSVSVTGKDLTNSFSSPGLPRWKSAIPQPHPLSGDFLAEYEGHTVKAKLTGNWDQSSSSNRAVPMVAFQGNYIEAFISQPDDEGNVEFYTRRANGHSHIVTSFAIGGGTDRQINIESPFISEHSSSHLPVLDIERIDKGLLLDQSVSLQVQYAYVADSLELFDYPRPHFFYKPDFRYIMEEYRKFGTMREVITEYITFVQFRNVDNKRRLSIIPREYRQKNDFQSLVLLDGIPVFDHEIIFNYNPLLLERIDVYLDQFVFGGLRFDGIVAMYTEKNSAPELFPDPFTRIVPYDMPQAPRLFYSPDYSEGDGTRKRLPDFRHTLYWNPEIKTDGESTVTIPFYTSDIAGQYRILVEGITKNGEVVWATTDITVK